MNRIPCPWPILCAALLACAEASQTPNGPAAPKTQMPTPAEPAAGVDPLPPPPPPEPDPTPIAPPVPPVRFVAFGDSGTGKDGQRRVATAVAEVCADRGGCDFGLLLGDNFYPAGVESKNDSQWQEKFEEPYGSLGFPFYATLGNHDYGAPSILDEWIGGIGLDPERAQAQLDYARTSTQFRMPDSIYRFSVGAVELVSINTTPVFWDDLSFLSSALDYDVEIERQEQLLDEWARAPLARFRIAFGHHPFLSNGPHGNAGSYDGVMLAGVVGGGTRLKEFFEERIIGQFDVYLCGHDHSLQDLYDMGRTSLVVSGGGAKHTELSGASPAHFEASELGFALFTVDAEHIELTLAVVADDGSWRYAHSRTLH